MKNCLCCHASLVPRRRASRAALWLIHGLATLACLLAVLPATLNAQTTTSWDGSSAGTGTFWTTSSNWENNTLPPSAADSNIAFRTRTSGGLISNMSVSNSWTFGLITFDNSEGALPPLLELSTNSTGANSRTLTLYTGMSLLNSSTTVLFNGLNGTLSVVFGANSSFDISAGATLQFASNIVMSGAYRLTKYGEGTLIVDASNTFTGGVTIGRGTLRIGSGTGLGSAPASYVADQVVIDGGTLEYTGGNFASSSNRGFALGAGGGTIRVSGSGTYQINAVISDYLGQAGALIKTGAGTLYLNPGEASTYSAGTTVASGTLQFGVAGSLGTGAINLGFSGGGDATLESIRAGYNLSNDINVVESSEGILTIRASSGSSFNSTFSGTLRLGDNVTVRSDVAPDQAMRLTGAITGSKQITKTGAGVLRLENNNNQFSGSLNISEGVVQLGNGSTTGDIGTATVVNNSTLVVNRSNNLTLNNNISGNGSVLFSGTGTTSMNSDNSYTGGTVVARGTVQFGRTNALGTGSVVLGSAGGGDATLDHYLAGWTTSNDFSTASGSGGVLTLSYSSSSTSFGSAVFTGSITVNDALVLRSEAGTGLALRLQGAVTGAGNITKTGAGVLRLENNNSSYSGNITLSSGTLQVGNNGTVGGLGSGAVVNNSSLLITHSNAYTLSNLMSGTGSLTQGGTGTTTVSNANSYSGGTLVQSGALMVTNTTGSATGSGSVTVTATLGGTGIVAPTGTNGVSISGVVAPGVAGQNNGIGRLTFSPVNGNVTFQSGSSVAFQISANGVADKMVFNASGSGVLDFSSMSAGSLGVTFAAGYTPALNDSFDLLDWSAVMGTGVSGLNASLLSLSTAGFDATWLWDTSQFATTGVITITVPEPGRALLFLGGMAGVALRRARGRLESA